MRRRILLAIVLVTATAVLLFAVPLGLAVSRLYLDDEVIRLEREAAQAGQQVGGDIAGDPVEFGGARPGTVLALYAPDGRRVLGQGPDRADRVVRAALVGRLADARGGGEIVTAVPVAREEAVVGVVRAARDDAGVQRRVRRAWLVMAGLGALVVALAALAALSLARRLARPVEELVLSAGRLGAGDFSLEARGSGIPELDAADAALVTTARRLRDVLERERAFTANASHQLRTPLAALRLELEAAVLEGTEPTGAAAFHSALVQVDRLESTVTALLDLARDAPRDRTGTDLRALLAELEPAWRAALDVHGRALRVVVDGGLPPTTAAAQSVREVLSVLVDNAARHGTGSVTIRVRSGGTDTIAVDVRDQGPGVGFPERLFGRRNPGSSGHGIGLTLARALAEADGGSLVYEPAAAVTTFTLLVPVQAASREAGG